MSTKEKINEGLRKAREKTSKPAHRGAQKLLKRAKKALS